MVNNPLIRRPAISWAKNVDFFHDYTKLLLRFQEITWSLRSIVPYGRHWKYPKPRGRASSKGAGAVVGPTGPMFVCWLVGLGILVPYWQAPFLLKDVFFSGGTLINGSHDICIFWWLLLKNGLGLDRRQFANDCDRRNLMKLFLLLSDANTLKPQDYLNKKLAVASMAFLPNIFVWICSARCKWGYAFITSI